MPSIDEIRRQFAAKTEGSRKIYERARRFLPGGTARGATAMQPYPLYARSAQGAIITDVDSNDYVDFNLEGGSCILGHCAPEIINRVKSQLDQMEVVSMASGLELELAERLANFFPFVEMMRFVNSGSEACSIVARIARAYTGKPLIAMCEGHHHGQLDTLLFSHYSPPEGSAETPTTVTDSMGMPPGSTDEVIILPFNNPSRSVELIKAHAARLAAVFFEPLSIFSGAIPAEADFVRAIREVTKDLGILLVADEVPGGVRIGPRGAVGGFGVAPDLFITGKSLAGGLAVGMYGGRRDILDPLLSPPYNPRTKVLSSGTFSGNPTVLSACLAVMDALQSGEVHRYINKLGDHTRAELREVGQRLGVPMQVTGAYSIFGIHFSEEHVKSVRQMLRDERRRDFALAMMNGGVLWPAGRIAGFLSFAHKEEHIERLVKACRQAIEVLFLQAAATA